MDSGYLAVDLFFVISGFVIAHAYDGRIAVLGWQGFMSRRLVRLYPLYLAGLALGLVVVLARGGADLGGVLVAVGAGVVMLPSPPTSFSSALVTPLNTAAWSLILEIGISLAYALLLRPSQGARRLVIVMAGAAVVLTAGVLALGHASAGSAWATLPTGIARVTFSFCAGILLYRFRHRLPRIGVPQPLVVLALIGFLALPNGAVRDLMFILLASPMIVVLALGRDRPSLSATLGATASYSIYILHMPVIALATMLLPLGKPLSMVAAIAVAMMVFAAMDRLVDRPARRWLTALIAARAARRPSSSAGAELTSR
jgi:peptidoglycan/LPS O-acetylase OafA/YrhL